MQRLRRILTIIAAAAILLVPSVPVFAADVFEGPCTINGADSSAICRDKAGGSTNPITGGSGILTKAVHVIAIVAGAAAIIMIILSGLRYVLSEGDPAKATQARNGLIYALVGLVVIIVAQTLVVFVLTKITS